MFGVPIFYRWIEVLSTATSLSEDLSTSTRAIQEEAEEEEQEAPMATTNGDHY